MEKIRKEKRKIVMIIVRDNMYAAHESYRINGGSCTGLHSKHRTGVGPGRLWNGSGSWDIRGKALTVLIPIKSLLPSTNHHASHPLSCFYFRSC